MFLLFIYSYAKNLSQKSAKRLWRAKHYYFHNEFLSGRMVYPPVPSLLFYENAEIPSLLNLGNLQHRNRHIVVSLIVFPCQA